MQSMPQLAPECQHRLHMDVFTPVRVTQDLASGKRRLVLDDTDLSAVTVVRQTASIAAHWILVPFP